MGDRGWRIGMCGTFDAANYGDLLFPLIAEAELGRRLGTVRLERFSYHEKTAPEWPLAVSPLAALPELVGTLDGMVIGGGDLVRFDKSVAPGYGPPTPAIHHPTGYWLTPALIALQNNCPVVWNAVGVHGEIPAWGEPLVKLALAMSSYVAVRDPASKQALSRLGAAADIRVVPDTAFGVAQFIDLDQPSAEYVRFRERHGLSGPYLVIQAMSGLQDFCRFVREQPGVFKGYRLLVLPIGPILGDDVALLQDLLPGCIAVSDWPAPLLIAELLGHAAAAVGTSLHLAITALAFGVPVFRPAASFGGKHAILLDFETVYPLDAGNQPDPEWFAARLGRADLLPATRKTVERLKEHWDAVASAFRTDRSEAMRKQQLDDFWQALPGQLEAAADGSQARWNTLAVEHQALLAARDTLLAERDQLEMQCEAMRESTSWKLTRPLRALGTLFEWRKIWRR